MMQTVEVKIEKKVETNVFEKPVFNEETLAVLAKNLNDWGVNKPELYLKAEFTYVSTSLLEEYGYFRKDGSFRLSYFVDLLNQAHEIVSNSRKYLGSVEPYFLDEIDLPDEKKGMILITQNSNGKMSIKLPNGR